MKKIPREFFTLIHDHGNRACNEEMTRHTLSSNLRVENLQLHFLQVLNKHITEKCV